MCTDDSVPLLGTEMDPLMNTPKLMGALSSKPPQDSAVYTSVDEPEQPALVS